MPPERLVGDFKAGWTYLEGQLHVRKGSVGMMDFSFGGGVTWLAATRMPKLKAAVPFYGTNPPLDEVPNIKAAVLARYRERDTRITQGIPTIEDAMKAQGKTFEKGSYPNAGHACHNDTGQAYNAEAANDAWTKTLAWFEKYLKA